jgi:hypothetical protein
MTGGMLSGVIPSVERAIENGSRQYCHEGSDWQRHAIPGDGGGSPRARASEIIVLPGRVRALRVDAIC